MNEDTYGVQLMDMNSNCIPIKRPLSTTTGRESSKMPSYKDSLTGEPLK